MIQKSCPIFLSAINKVETTKRPILVRVNGKQLSAAVISGDRTINIFITINGELETGESEIQESFAISDVSTMISSITSLGTKEKVVSIRWDTQRVQISSATSTKMSKGISLYLSQKTDQVMKSEGKSSIPDLGSYISIPLNSDVVEFLHKTLKISSSGFDRTTLGSDGKIEIGCNKMGKNTASCNVEVSNHGCTGEYFSRVVLANHMQSVIAISKAFPDDNSQIRLYQSVGQAISVVSSNFTLFFAVAQEDSFS